MDRNNPTVSKMIMTVRRLSASSDYIRALASPSVQVAASTGASGGRALENNAYWNHWVSLPVSYEIDLWGRLNARQTSAELAVTASEFELTSLKTTLTAALAEHYAIALSQKMIATVLATAREHGKEILNILSLKQKAGLLNQDALTPYQESVLEIDAMITKTKGLAASAERTILTLTGEPPREGWPGKEWLPPDWITKIPDAVPDIALEERPDLKALEAMIEASGYSMKEVRAEARPSVILTGDIHSGGENISDMLSSNNQGWGAFIKVSVPLFNRNKNSAEYESRKFTREEFVAQYRHKLLAARGEEASAINDITLEAGNVTIFTERQTILAEHQKSARRRHEAGLTDAIETRTAGKNLALLETERIRAEQKLLTGHIQFLRATASKTLAP